MNHSPSYIKALEGFRGVCILLVLLHNLFPYELQTSGIFAKVLRELAGAGWVGVQWFFVLSGFLITRILLDVPRTLTSIKLFYVRRCLRIFPLYYFTLLFLLVVLPTLGFIFPGTQNAIEHSGWFWFYVSNWVGFFGLSDIGLSHFWSLAVEEQFYLVWPWLILFLSPRNIKVFCVLLIISAAIARAVIAWNNPEHADTLNYVLTFVRWDALALGALLATVLRQEQWLKNLDRFFMPVLTFLLIWFLAVAIYMTDFKAVGEGIVVLNQTLAAFLGVACIFVVTGPNKSRFAFVQTIFESKILCHLGKHSYAIYVFHLIVAAGIFHFREFFGELIQFNMSSIAFEIFLLSLTLFVIYVMARLSWLLIELPCLKLKNKFV